MTAYYLFISPRRKTLWGLLCVYLEGVSPFFLQSQDADWVFTAVPLACCLNGDHCSSTSLQLFQIKKKHGRLKYS